MKCPFCKHDDTQVVDSRVNEEGDSIRRRRRCLSCDKRFTTYEHAELRLPQVPYLRWIVSSGASLPGSILDVSSLTAASRTVSDELLRQIESEVHPSDQMIEIYTSGSMALPKGVKHHHGPVLFRTHYIRSMLPLARGQDVRAWLPTIRVPTLVIVGRADVISPPDEMQAIADAIPGSEFHVIETAGHMAPLESPAEFNRLLTAFVERV